MTGHIRHISVKKWRLAIASLIGTAYTFTFFVSSIGWMYHPWMKFLISILLVWSAFGYRSFLNLFKNLSLFYFLTFVIGGGIYGIYFFLQSRNELIVGMMTASRSNYGDPVSWAFVLTGIPLMYWFSKRNLEAVESYKTRGQDLVKLDIYLGSPLKSGPITCKGLVDTGNQLFEPITRIPIIVVEASQFHSRIPESMVHLSNEEILIHEVDRSLANLSDEWLTKVRVIPFHGVGKSQMQFLIAFRPERIVIHSQQGIFETERVLVGLQGKKLTKDDSYQAIIHPHLLMLKNKVNQIEGGIA
ncbi:sigma-E processing peptidase SpoIIGA [Microaerobacter geothermalis]|nr:sigma-E processing peptidase SpoIIGA [Microaerobacter geothermalis]